MSALSRNASRPRPPQPPIPSYSGPGADETHAEAGQRRALEAGRRPAAEQLVAGRRERDEAEDRGHACGGRGALEEARPAEDHEVRRGPGQDDRDRPEDRPELHDPVVAQAIGDQPERRRQHELGAVERHATGG